MVYSVVEYCTVCTWQCTGCECVICNTILEIEDSRELDQQPHKAVNTTYNDNAYTLINIINF